MQYGMDAAVRRNTHPHGGIIIPNLHIGGDIDRKRLVAGPRIRLSFENKRVLVAIRPAHRLAHGLGTGSDRRQAGSEDSCCPGEEETVLDEIPALVACAHDAALRSRAMTAPSLPPSRSLPPCRLDTSASADLVRLDVELARRAYFSESARATRASCSGPPLTGSVAVCSRLLAVAGSASALSISALRRAIADGGVRRGTKAAYHVSSTRLLKPASCSVGTSGRFGERVSDDCASRRKFPDL